MNITLKTTKLRELLAIAAKCAMSKPTMPILGCILLRASKQEQRIYIGSTNLYLSIRASVAAEVDGDFSIAVNAGMLVSIASKVDGENISLGIVSKNSAIKVTCGAATFRLLGIGAGEFPPFPAPPTGTPVVFSHADLLLRLNGVLIAASTDETRYVLNGVFMKCADGVVTFVATDGRRLHVFNGVTESKTSVAAIIPSAAAQRLIAMLKHAGNVKIWISERSAAALIDREDGNIEFFTKVVEGNYPDYTKVIPSRTEFLSINSADLSAAVSRVAMVTNEKGASVKVDIAGEVLTVSASSPDLGEAKETLALLNKFEHAGSVAFNPTLLLGAIDGSAAEKIEFSIDPKSPEVSPLMIKAADFKAVVMPVRLT